MKQLLRPMLLVALVLAVPILPFLAFQDQVDQIVKTWLAEAPSSALIACVIGLLAMDIVLPVPSSVVSTLAGGRLSLAMAVLASWIGMTAGACLGFMIARWFGRSAAELFASSRQLQQMHNVCEKYGTTAILLTRPLPILAEATVLILGIHQVAWQRFLVPVMISNFVITVVYSTFGQIAAEQEWLPIALYVSIAVPVFATYPVRRQLCRRK